MDLPTDESLVKKYLDGDDEALRILVERYLKSVYNFAYRYTGKTSEAEDITQDVFVSVWKHLKRFDTSRKFKTWIFTITKNAALNWLKKKKPVLFSEFGNGEENVLEELFEDASPLPDKLFEEKNLKQKLSSAMDKINPDYRTVIILKHDQDFTFQEIAEILDEPLDTVKSRYRRGIIVLRKLLQD